MRIRRNEGFTLIELMIVVAIIGILAAIAIPNFLKFQCKSKQSEAKTNLAGLFTAEKSFFGEYNSYGSDLVSVNWIPDGSPLYIYGISATFPAVVPGIPSWNSGYNNTMNASVYGNPARYSSSKTKDLAGAALAIGDLPSTNLNGQSFTAGASGDIDTDPAIQLDQWQIDNQKNLQNFLNDCTN